MRVAVIYRYFPPAYLAGGPVQTLSALVRGAPDDIDVDVLTTNGDHGVPDALPVEPNVWGSWHRASVLYASGGLWSVLRGLRSVSRRRPQYVYVNSLFDQRFSFLPQVLVRLGMFPGARILIAPRGELNPGALRLKHGKKRIFLAAYRTLGFARNATWHASTELEADDIRREFGPAAMIVVRPNDTSLPREAHTRSTREPGPCRLIFASRLSRKKRLDLFLRALSLVEGEYRLRVVGAFDDPAYERLCLDLAASGRLRERVDFVGSLTRDRVLRELANSDVFVFPTAGENFGHVIAEALSTSCPVIVSDNTPWSAILREGGGVVVGDDRPASYAEAVTRFIDGGEDGWADESRAAGTAFDRWQRDTEAPHLFELLTTKRCERDAF